MIISSQDTILAGLFVHRESVQQSNGVLRKDNCTVCGISPAKCSKIKKNEKLNQKKKIQSISLFLAICFTLWKMAGLLFLLLLCTVVS